MDERGKIKNRGRSKQIRDFSGLRYGNITPTDIDCLIEYHDKAYVIIEYKYGGAEVLFGQRLALERLHDDVSKIKPVLCIIAQHNQEDCELDIDCANALVMEVRGHGVWIPVGAGVFVKQLVDDFLKNVNS